MTNTRQRPDPIYLDHAATSPLRAEVWATIEAALDCGYNPVSAHALGRRAHARLEDARAEFAELLGCRPREICFTGGGTESDNLAILGFARANLERGACLILSEVEHKACLEAARRAGAEGAEIRALPVNISGEVRLAALERALAETAGRPTLVSIMWANNEVGTVQPMAEIEQLVHQSGALLHTDAVQAFGKEDVSLDTVPADMLTATAHKLGGPVGIGLLFRREDVPVPKRHYTRESEIPEAPAEQGPGVLGIEAERHIRRTAAEQFGGIAGRQLHAESHRHVPRTVFTAFEKRHGGR